MYIVAVFIDDNIPVESLTPLLYVKDIAEGILDFVKNGVAMTELGKGAYKYSFDDLNNLKDYYILIDGGSTLHDENRYQVQIIKSDYKKNNDDGMFK